jgi:hypothetical protein
VDDSIEGARAERESCAGCHEEGRAALKALTAGALLGVAEAANGDVCEDDLTTGLLRDVEAGPAATGADVQEPPAGTKIEALTEEVGLGDGGVAPDTEVGAVDLLLHEEIRAGLSLAVDLREALRGTTRVSGPISHG